MDTGDTAFILICSALVMFMTPGLALFYGGMVRSKNVLGTIMQSVFALGLVSVLWVVIGYTLAFGPDKGGLIGGLDFLGFSGVGAAGVEPRRGSASRRPLRQELDRRALTMHDTSARTQRRVTRLMR